jgi:hypothetical protein
MYGREYDERWKEELYISSDINGGGQIKEDEMCVLCMHTWET